MVVPLPVGRRAKVQDDVEVAIRENLPQFLPVMYAMQLPRETTRILLLHPDPRFRDYAMFWVIGANTVALELIFQEQNLDLAANLRNIIGRQVLFSHFIDLPHAERNYEFLRKLVYRTKLYPDFDLCIEGPDIPAEICETEFLQLALENPENSRRSLGRELHCIQSLIKDNPDHPRLRKHYTMTLRWLRNM